MGNTRFWNNNDYIDADGYYHHHCGSIIMRVSKDTSINDCFCYCKKCKCEFELENIVNGTIVKSKPITIKETA